MTQPLESAVPAARRPIVVAGVAILVAVGAWFIAHAFIPPASRECLMMYRAARTAADSARIDGTVPRSSGVHNPEAKSCGFIRTAARW